MIDVLGTLALPLLPGPLSSCLVDADAKEVTDHCQLIANSVSRAHGATAPLVAALLPRLVERAHVLLTLDRERRAAGASGTTASFAGAGLSPEEARDGLEMEKSIIGLGAALASSNILPEWITSPDAPLLGPLISMLCSAAASHAEVLVRKTALAALTRTLQQATGGPPSTPAAAAASPPHDASGRIAALQDLAVLRVGAECCLAPLLQREPQYEPRDANGVALLSEVAAAHLLLAQRWGAPWLAQLQASGFIDSLTAAQGADAVNLYLGQLRAGDSKAARASLRRYLETFRGNGLAAPVFRPPP